MEKQVKKFVVLVDNIYEDLELWYPKIRLEEEGARVVVAGPQAIEKYRGKHGYPCQSDIAFEALKVEDFDGVVIPGGFAPDKIRQHKQVCSFVAQMDAAGKLVASICHGGWVLVSAKILKGRKATSYMGIKDDMENAGAVWSDEPVVIDQNLITSRMPTDLPPFMKAIIGFNS